MKRNQFLGVATVTYSSNDLIKAKEWYSNLFNIPPYFEVNGYIKFRIGVDSVEFGIVDSKYTGNNSSTSTAGAIVYWQVADIDTVSNEIIKTGGSIHQPKTNRGNGFVTASFIDPFGNIIGIMQNPHYMENRKK